MIMISYDYSISVINQRRLVILKAFSWMKFLELRLIFRYTPINNKSELAEVLTWCWTGDTPLTAPMMTQFDDAYMRHPTQMSPSVQTKLDCELEQLERLRSEDTPHRLMITHTIESCWIPSQNKVESPWIYRSRSKVITCDTPSHASNHLYQIWEESTQNYRRYRVDTIFKVKAEWPWKYRSRSKVIACNTPSNANDDLCQI